MNEARDMPALQRWFITGSTMLAATMQALDMTIANVALPHIQGAVSATQDEISWVLTSYIIGAAIATPLTGWLVVRTGRRRIFLFCVAGFTVTSFLCGLSSTIEELVIFRTLQGACGAALLPMSQLILLDINPPERHGQAMALWASGVTLGPILGPILGGWLTEVYTWRWVFFINIPFGILAFTGLWTYLSDSQRQKAHYFDFFGFGSLILGIGFLQLMLDRGQTKGWFDSTEIWIEAVLGAIFFYLFVIHTATAKRSFLPRDLLRDRNFVVGTMFGIVVGTMFFSPLALLPAQLQNLMGYPVITTGMVTAPRGIGMLVAMTIVGRIVNKVDMRIILVAGLLCSAFSLWQMSQFTLEMGPSLVIWSGVWQGAGIGLLFVPFTTLAFATLEPHLRAEGTAFFTVFRNIASSAGISLTAAFLSQNTQILHSTLVEHVRPDNPLARAPFVSDQFNLDSLQGIAAVNAEVTRQAMMMAYANDYWMLMLMTLCAIPLIVFMRKMPKHGETDKPMHIVD
jgi:DHA2 family multidrug resistance protein